MRIAKQLMEDKIPITRVKGNTECDVNYYSWGSARISSRMERRYLADASEMEKERERLEARNQEIDEMFLNLYSDKAKGILSEQRFVKLTAATLH